MARPPLRLAPAISCTRRRVLCIERAIPPRSRPTSSWFAPVGGVHDQRRRAGVSLRRAAEGQVGTGGRGAADGMLSSWEMRAGGPEHELEEGVRSPSSGPAMPMPQVSVSRDGMLLTVSDRQMSVLRARGAQGRRGPMRILQIRLPAYPAPSPGPRRPQGPVPAGGPSGSAGAAHLAPGWPRSPTASRTFAEQDRGHGHHHPVRQLLTEGRRDDAGPAQPAGSGFPGNAAWRARRRGRCRPVPRPTTSTFTSAEAQGFPPVGVGPPM